MDDQQRQRFQSAVERKKEQAKTASEQDPRRDIGGEDAIPDEQPSMIERSRPQEIRDPRAKNEGHRKKTADKWNQ